MEELFDFDDLVIEILRLVAMMRTRKKGGGSLYISSLSPRQGDVPIEFSRPTNDQVVQAVCWGCRRAQPAATLSNTKQSVSQAPYQAFIQQTIFVIAQVLCSKKAPTSLLSCVTPKLKFRPVGWQPQPSKSIPTTPSQKHAR